VIVEHPVEMELVGSPRWWTVSNQKGSWEVVRVLFQKGTHYFDEEAPEEMLIFAMLKPDHMKWPPLIVAAIRMGEMGWDDIRERGGKIVIYDEPLGRKLELMLMWKG